MTNLTLVAYYRALPEPLAGLLLDVQDLLAQELGDLFLPRGLEQVHGTLIGFEKADPRTVETRLDELLTWIRVFLEKGLVLQFGGYPVDHFGHFSRNLSPYERSFQFGGSTAILIGWPVLPEFQDPVPTMALDYLRLKGLRLGFSHKYYERPGESDPDFYLALGDLREEIPAMSTAQERVRTRLLDAPVRVALTPQDVFVARYENRHLPLESTSVSSLVEFTRDFCFPERERP